MGNANASPVETGPGGDNWRAPMTVKDHLRDHDDCLHSLRYGAITDYDGELALRDENEEESTAGSGAWINR